MFVGQSTLLHINSAFNKAVKRVFQNPKGPIPDLVSRTCSSAVSQKADRPSISPSDFCVKNSAGSLSVSPFLKNGVAISKSPRTLTTHESLGFFGLAIDKNTNCLIRVGESQFNQDCTFIVKRHGKTQFNHKDVTQGLFCPDEKGQTLVPELSEKGRLDTEASAILLKQAHSELCAVVMSYQHRAQQTADIVCQHYKNTVNIQESALSEVHAGKIEGRSSDEQLPEHLYLYMDRCDAVHKIGETGESIVDKLTALANMLRRVNYQFRNSSKPVLLVTHSNTFGLLDILFGHGRTKDVEGVHALVIRNKRILNNEFRVYKKEGIA